MSPHFAGSSTWPEESHLGSFVAAADFEPVAVRCSTAGLLPPTLESCEWPQQLAADHPRIEEGAVGEMQAAAAAAVDSERTLG